MRYKFIEHTADLKFQSFGKTLNEVFENSALALTSHLHDRKVKPLAREIFKIEGIDLEAIMFRFLEEVLFLFETEGFLVSEAKVKFTKDKKGLEAELVGEKETEKTARHYIKAVTYNDMFVKKIKNQFVAQVVLDV